MANTYWHRQTSDKPLFENILWSRPENKRYAGKLLIVGGNSHGFTAPANAYAAALKAGIGTVRVILPDKLAKTVGKLIPEAQFAPSTPSGSFARLGLAKLLEEADWADGVLLAGNFGKNSETAVLLEGFIDKYDGLLSATDDTVDYFINNPAPLLGRYNNVITLDFMRLQKLVKPILIKHDDNLMSIVTKLHEITQVNKASIITFMASQIIVASGGQVSTTPAKEVNLVELAAYASVWRLQQPQKPFEAITSAVHEYVAAN